MREVEADVLMQQSLVFLADQLDEHLQNDTLPEPDGSALETAAVRAVTWTDTPEALTVDVSDMEHEAALHEQLAKLIPLAEGVRAKLGNRLAARVGKGMHGDAGDYVVTYSRTRNVLNEQRVLDDFPQLGMTVLDRGAAKQQLGAQLDDYSEPIGARVLTVKQRKGNT